MRILLGTFEIARQLYDLADGFRALGHDVDTVMSFCNPQHPELEYTRHVDPARLQQQFEEWGDAPISSLTNGRGQDSLLKQLLTSYDVYVFQFGHSLLPQNRDLPILKQLGKKVISLFMGSDIRHWSGVEPIARAYGYHRLPPHYREHPYNHLDSRLHPLRMAERYADVVYSNPFQSGLAVRPYHHITLAFRLSLFEHYIPARDAPVIVHAPSRTRAKGTAEFMATLERLAGEGIKFDLRLLKNKTNQEVREALVDADLVLDQPNSPHYAMLALEGMASGCAVAGGRHLDFVPCQGDSPVFHIQDHMIYERIKRLLTDKELRVALAKRGRAFVERHHDHVRVAQNMLSELDRPSRPDYYPTFLARRYELPPNTSLHPEVQTLTAEVCGRWGLPYDVQPESLAERGLADAECLASQPWIMRRYPRTTDVREQIWGWSDSLVDSNAPRDERAVAVLVDLLYDILHVMEHNDFAHARRLFERARSYAADHHAAVTNTDVLAGLSRIADMLDQPRLAAEIRGALAEPTPAPAS